MLSGFRYPERIAVFISGGGSTLQTLLEMQHQINISIIVTNRKSSIGVIKAKRFGKQVLFFNKEMGYDQLDQLLKQYKINKIFLAGFMKLLPAEFVELWRNRIVNIHPSLLPKYPGLNAAERSWNDNEDIGVSIHQVTEEVDAGKIMLQQKSLINVRQFNLNEVNFFLRRTEQHLLREFTLRCS